MHRPTCFCKGGFVILDNRLEPARESGALTARRTSGVRHEGGSTRLRREVRDHLQGGATVQEVYAILGAEGYDSVLGARAMRAAITEAQAREFAPKLDPHLRTIDPDEVAGNGLNPEEQAMLTLSNSDDEEV